MVCKSLRRFPLHELYGFAPNEEELVLCSASPADAYLKVLDKCCVTYRVKPKAVNPASVTVSMNFSAMTAETGDSSEVLCIGLPVRLTVCPRTPSRGQVELKLCKGDKMLVIDKAKVVSKVQGQLGFLWDI